MSEFAKWFGKYIQKELYEGLGPNATKAANEAWKEARKGYVKLEDVIKTIRRHTPKIIGYRGQIVTEEDCLFIKLNNLKEEIKQLGGK